MQCFLQAHFFGGNEIPLHQKNLKFPPTAAKLCALILFFGRDNELRTYRGNFDLMHSKHWKLFVAKQSQGCKFMPKMHKKNV